jgi:hypothetical protein
VPFYILIKTMMGFVVAVPIDPLGLCASIERCGWVPGMDFFPAWVSLR